MIFLVKHCCEHFSRCIDLNDLYCVEWGVKLYSNQRIDLNCTGVKFGVWRCIPNILPITQGVAIGKPLSSIYR